MQFAKTEASSVSPYRLGLALLGNRSVLMTPGNMGSIELKHIKKEV